MIILEHVNKIYGSGDNKVVALDDVSFTVNDGEFVAIIVRQVLANQHLCTQSVVLMHRQVARL